MTCRLSAGQQGEQPAPLKTDKYFVEQIYTGCVAEACYFIVSNGEAVIIDPLRETQPYMDRLKEHNATLKYVFETHFHADFVSGHEELSKLNNNCPIVYGPLAEPKFKATIAEDNQVFQVGDISLTVLHTPGHTMESSCFLLKDDKGENKAIFTGDTLFIGDVGRPDLAQKGAELTQEDLATYLYNSLRNKIMPLACDLIVYPGHGAGSACGKNMSTKTWDSLGNQKKFNYALRADMTVGEFIEELTADLPPPPTYFPAAVGKNKGTATEEDADGVGFAKIWASGNKPLSVEDFQAAMDREENQTHPSAEFKDRKLTLIFDTRETSEFTKAHIPGSVFAGLREGNMGPHVASAVGDISRPFLVVGDNADDVEECITRLSRFGFDRPIGYLAGGMAAWIAAKKPTTSIINITPEELAARVDNQNETPLNLVDVRKPGEYKSRHHTSASNVPMDIANMRKMDFTHGDPVTYCRGAYRSVVFSSLFLHCYGHERSVTSVLGGFEAMEKIEKLAAKMDMSPCQRAKREAAAKAAAEKAAA